MAQLRQIALTACIAAAVAQITFKSDYFPL